MEPRSGLLGTKRASALAPMATLAGILVWGGLTWWTGDPTWRDPRMWQLLLLASLILDVALLLDSEWSARGADKPTQGDARGLGQSALILLLIQAVVIVLFQWVDDDVLVAGAAALIVANLVVARLVSRGLRRIVDRRLAQSNALGMPRVGLTEAHKPGTGEPKDASAPYVVACSGGGIRAAAFVLGGVNALQTATTKPWHSPSASPRFVAVSGGSYTAAAIALTRSFGVGAGAEGREARALTPPLPWTTVYRDKTPEMRRLRKHTRDLFEPRSELLLGLAALLLGAALNVFLAIAAIRVVSWVIAWFSRRAGDLRLGATCDGSLCSVFDGWNTGRPWWTDETVVVWLALTLVTVLSGIWLWISQGRINRLRKGDVTGGDVIPDDDIRRRDRLRRVRSATQSLAAGWFLAFVALPGLVAGLNHLAVDNTPTPAVASLLSGLGFSTPTLCEQAGGRSMVAAVTAATAAARISPGESRSAHGGACGIDTEVTVTVDAATSTCSVSAPSVVCPAAREGWRALGIDLVRAEQGGGGVRGLTKVAGSLVAFLTLLQTLRASITVDDAVAGPGAGRLRRVLLMRLPILVVALTGLWLLARWVFQASVDLSAASSWSQVLVPLGALLAALLVDANVTSMHDFYRDRLASAFAAGRTAAPTGARASADADDPAYELPPGRFYRFSELGTLPLTIATTANVQAYESVPTRRGGAPVTFDNRNVTLHSGSPETSRTVAVADYEESVGYGYASVMSIVAMSGAAVSPMMGRFAATFGPFRLLLALFNIRVGVWVPNPRYAPPEEMTGQAVSWREGAKQWPTRPWFTGRPGAAQVLKEAFGQCSFDDQWLYLTDGGHLDNTGLVESVRIALGEQSTAPGGWRYVVALDASNDKEGTWAAVGDALSVIRADLGARLERVEAGSRTFGTEASTVPQRVVRSAFGRRRTEPDQRDEPDFARRYVDRANKLRVLVVKAVRPVDLDHADLPDSVRAFAMSTSDFPRASTSRQDFSDLEFEAYRELGEWCTRQAIDPTVRA